MPLDAISNYRQVRVLLHPHQGSDRTSWSVMARDVRAGVYRDREIAKGHIEGTLEDQGWEGTLRYIAEALNDLADRL